MNPGIAPLPDRAGVVPFGAGAGAGSGPRTGELPHPGPILRPGSLALGEEPAPVLRYQSVIDLASGRARFALKAPPVLTSLGGPWKGFVLEHHQPEEGFEVRESYFSDHLVVTAVERPSTLAWHERAASRELTLRPGQTFFVPASVPFGCRSEQPGDFLALSLSPAYMRCAAHEISGSRPMAALSVRDPAEDPFLSGALRALRAEVLAGYPGQRAYGESLAHAIALHLVRECVQSPVSEPVPGSPRLSRLQLQRALAYIHEHLSEEIPLTMLARVAGLSPFHFCRTFKQSTGLSPHRYVIQQRVERARDLLLAGARRISDVALSVGFCDQSHLTSHFKRQFGLTPREFRLQALPVQDS